MRIGAGRYQGHAIVRPRAIRPTADKVRAALFNILGEAVSGAAVLDVCAGSGALGLEAFSRGATQVTWIDRDPQCCAAIRRTLREWPGAAVPGVQVICADALQALRRLGANGRSFELVLLDPPYRDISLLKRALQALEAHAILRPSGWVVIEHERRTDIAQLIVNKHIAIQRTYGDTMLSVCQQAPYTSRAS